MAPERLSRKRYRCRFCGEILPAWHPGPQIPDDTTLFTHLSRFHPTEMTPYLERMRTENIATVVAEIFYVVEEERSGSTDPYALRTPLYHYTDARGLLGIIQSQTLWATNIHYLNDSQEYHHAVGIAKAVILDRAQATADQREKEALMALGTRLTPGSSIVRIFVASFSEKGDLLSQWRGYCPNGAGYSIGFVAKALCNEAAMQGFRLAPCLYDYEAQREVIEKVLTEFMESVRWTEALGALDNDHLFRRAIEAWLDSFAPVAPILKHPGFREEHEWRLISKPIWPGDPQWKVRPGRSMLIPYVPIKLAVIGAHLPLEEIIVGPTPHMELACMAVGDWLDHEGISKWGLHNILWTVRSSRIPYQNW